MKSAPDLYKPAEACRMAEVAPYVLRYWETEFSALSEGKERGPARLYSARDVKIISRIRELLYDEGFTVAGAKKRLEAEIREGRFDDGEAAPPISEQKKRMEGVPASAKASAGVVGKSANEPLFHAGPDDQRPKSAGASDIPDLKALIKELREIVRLLDRPRRA